jgi:hypothetical protein
MEENNLKRLKKKVCALGYRYKQRVAAPQRDPELHPTTKKRRGSHAPF